LLRHKILEKGGYTCSRCRNVFDENSLVVHHISEFETTILCRQCHKLLHYGEKQSRVRRIYVPAEFEPTMETLKEILKREGRSISGWIRDNADQYVRLHEPGNPQQRLDTILKLGKAYHAPGPICGFKNCLRDGVAVGIFLPTKKPFHICSIHLTTAEADHRNWNILTNEKGD